MGLQVRKDLLEDLLRPEQCLWDGDIRKLILLDRCREVLNAVDESVLHDLLHRGDRLDAARNLRVEVLR